MESTPNVTYKHKLSDFEVVSTNVLKDYNIYSSKVLGNGHYTAGYEIYEISKFLWFKTRPYAPRVRFETLKEVDDYIFTETGEHFIEDLA